MRVAPFGEARACRSRLGRDDELDRLELGLDRFETLEELLADEEHARGRIVEDLRDFEGREPPVHRREDGTELRRAEQQLEELRHVLVEHRDPIAVADAGGAERACDLVGARVELRIGGRGVPVRDRGSVAHVTVADELSTCA